MAYTVMEPRTVFIDQNKNSECYTIQSTSELLRLENDFTLNLIFFNLFRLFSSLVPF